MKPTDVRPKAVALYFLPLRARMPLKFGPETVTEVTCARVKLTVEDRRGRKADGWGETPLSVTWVWPSSLPYAERNEALQSFCGDLARSWSGFDCWGHALEVGHAFVEQELPRLHAAFNATRAGREPMPWLAALVCCSAFDQALHDAYGVVNDVPVYQTYNADYLNADLAAYLEPLPGHNPEVFVGHYPADFIGQLARTLPAWHLVGGLDPLSPADLTGQEPKDGYPVLLRDWIKQDGLRCLKVKLRGNDAAWDYERLVAVGQIGLDEGCDWLTADFNCTVRTPEYVTGVLDRLLAEQPAIYRLLLYVEQPFPYDLEEHAMDVLAVSARKPLFLDESAHDWRMIRLGRSLGWSGVALKTCKTQTGALLSLCWARAYGMPLMVQDLSNPMIAQIPHLLLAAHAGTIQGVETNGMQFYPDASRPEAAVHPGLYARRQGRVDLSSIQGSGFGYRLTEVERTLPPPAFTA